RQSGYRHFAPDSFRKSARGLAVTMKSIRITDHAVARFLERCRYLHLKGDAAGLRHLLSTARREERPNNRTSRMHFLKREILRGKALYLVAEGWRLVVSGRMLITVERVKPHENHTTRGRREDHAGEEETAQEDGLAACAGGEKSE